MKSSSDVVFIGGENGDFVKVLLMADLMVKDDLLKALLMSFGFGTPSDRSQDGLIGPFDPLVDVYDMVDMRYVDGEHVDYCQMSVYYVCRYYLSFWFSLIHLDFRFLLFLVFLVFINSYKPVSLLNFIFFKFFNFGTVLVGHHLPVSKILCPVMFSVGMSHWHSFI